MVIIIIIIKDSPAAPSGLREGHCDEDDNFDNNYYDDDDDDGYDDDYDDGVNMISSKCLRNWFSNGVVINWSKRLNFTWNTWPTTMYNDDDWW